MPTKTIDEVETRQLWIDNAFLKRVKAAFDANEDASDKDVAESLDVAKGQVVLARMRLSVPVKERLLLGDDEAAATKASVRLRDSENLSWGMIAATLGIPESKVRALYTTATGTDSRGLRIGKGGRYPGESNGSAAPAKKATTKKAAAKKAATKAAAPAKKAAKKATSNDPTGESIMPRKPLVEMNKTELAARINGQTITVGRKGKPEKIAVRVVTGLKGGEMSLTDTKGKGRVVSVENVTNVTR